MRLLLTSDLHSQSRWFDWISRTDADAILIAGDLVDGFSPEGLVPQMIAVSQWAERLQCPLAFCSGNHDANFLGAIQTTEPAGVGSIAEKLVGSPRWMDTLTRPGVVVDGRSEIAGWGCQWVVVSTIPYSGFDGGQLTDSLWETGARLRTEHRLLWFVLHHEPPAGTSVGGAMGDTSLTWKIQEYQPDYVVSGHLHEQPYLSDGNFADRIGKTWCFNPGFPPINNASGAEVPNHIIIDTLVKTAEWHATTVKGHSLFTQSLFLE